MVYSYKDIYSSKQKVLFVTAHPDDVDVFFGGTICKLAADGKDIQILILTRGSRGSGEKYIAEMDLAKTRIDEEIRSLQILGVPREKIKFLDYLDGEVEDSMELIRDISLEIRNFQPDIVCSIEPHGYYHSYQLGGYYINQRDHRFTGIAVLDSVYPYSRDRSFFKEQSGKVWIVKDVFLSGEHYINAEIDITDIITRKHQALLCHQSQFSAKDIAAIMSEFSKQQRCFEVGTYLKLAW